ncbi:CpsD/CapB family tyrosine-protein kinase [Desulfoluna butyratoxydans]|uniref:non-specific protein-tyrosine kinase n=1 Tax=Desulfoluna butyratoxydans TaxID=231438 RepID=A0A4U8YLL7_9BACT|nr:CpsD/CapB family tyrosine-protein kinase [Desulfoluna butyratoxydans]VFQ44324.1 exopolysaccharide synthesis protein [Desulfoluna butyratoxydans]
MGIFRKAVPRKGAGQGGGGPGTLVAQFDPWGFGAEQFRAVKTSIMFPADGREIRTLLVTSAVPGEGKTFVAANIAASIAGSMDNHVLVVDSDMRHPSMAAYFSLSPQVPGLDYYLNHRCALEEVIYHTEIDKLSVLPAGGGVPNPSELITSSTMTRMIGEVRERYEDRYVIIDSPPPLFAPETIALAKHVDGIIVVVRNDKTLKKSVADLLERLDRSRVVGIVLNRHKAPFGVGYGYRNYPYGKSGSSDG